MMGYADEGRDNCFGTDLQLWGNSIYQRKCISTGAWRKDNLAAWTDSCTKHKDHFFPGSRWLENCVA
ncbi:hypothetical protein AAHA92_10349 [Salvia divinorum]|uniref:Uncharacterized protein n=1 Tax=Salvia divinorum TaxID=28513 RepID=A0ABD1HWY4_SALDI